MRLLIFTALVSFLLAPLAKGEESSVYTCHFEEDSFEFSSLRMKKYFDAQQNMQVGKVDLIRNFMVVESTPTKVYQIPLLDNQSYIQIWLATTVRVDAQLSYSQGVQEFRATYTKNSESHKLRCVELRD